MALETVLKSWGREELIYNEEYCAKLLVYSTPGIASSLHYHSFKKETFIVTSGVFRIELGALDGASYKLLPAEEYTPGDSITLPPLTLHRIRCIKPGVIVECSTHDDPDDCTRLIPSES